MRGKRLAGGSPTVVTSPIRIANISATPDGANDPVVLQPGSTVLDDTDVDTLFGEGDTDWFLSSQTGLIPDIVADLEGGEVETDIG